MTSGKTWRSFVLGSIQNRSGGGLEQDESGVRIIRLQNGQEGGLTMKEYIEREALKEVFERYLNSPHVQIAHSVGQGMRIAIESCILLLDNEKAADVVERKRGEWEKSAEGYRICNRCKADVAIFSGHKKLLPQLWLSDGRC